MKKLLQIAACSMAVFAGAWCLSQYYIKQNPLVPAPDTQDIERAQELAHRIATRHKAVKNSPKNIKLRWALAETYSKAGYVDAAATHMQIIVAQAPDFLPARLSLGNIYIAKEEWEKAEEIFRFLVKRNTNVPEVWGSLAAVLYRQAKYLPAVQAAARAVKLEPADANHRYIMGVSYLEFAMQYSDPRTQRGALQVAVQQLSKVAETWSDNSDVYFRLGRASGAMRDWPNAIRHLKRAEELSPHQEEVAVHLARVYVNSGKNVEALKVVRSALVHHPQSPSLNQSLGLLLQDSTTESEQQEMYAALRKAAQLKPNEAIYQDRLGNACLRLNKIEEARVAFEKSVSLNPNRAMPYQQLAVIYTRLNKTDIAGQYAKAATEMTFNERQLERFETLSAQFPNNPKLHVILADRYRDLGRVQVARNEYLLALAMDPKNKKAQTGIAALNALEKKKPLQASSKEAVQR